MKLVKIFLYLNLICVAAFFSGCSNNIEKTTQQTKEVKTQSLVTKGVVKNQIEPPKKGEEIVVFNVKDYGVIKCRLFPKVAPNSVNRFKELVKSKKLDGVELDEVAEKIGVKISQEDIKTVKEEKHKLELNKSVHHLKGALCIVKDDNNLCQQGINFYIVSNKNATNANFDDIKNSTNSFYKKEGLNIKVEFDENTKKMYKENGGDPTLDMQDTIIGQVYEGLEVVEKLNFNKKDMMNNEMETKEEKTIILEKAEILKI